MSVANVVSSVTRAVAKMAIWPELVNVESGQRACRGGGETHGVQRQPDPVIFGTNDLP